MSRRAVWLPALAIAASALFSAADAQELRGTIHDSTTRQPISGAVVSVLDAGGRSIARGITNDRGQFRVATQAGGREVSIKRIGFHPRVIVMPTDIAASVDIFMTPLASLLESIQVNDVTKCSKRSDRAAALALWEQVRTGLLATVVAGETNPARVRRLVFDRTLGPDDTPRSQSVRIDSAQTDRPFGAALTVADFLAKGFTSDSAGAEVFYGPDAEILLSDGFAAGYCFRLADHNAERPAQVGLAFSPAERRRDRIDIEGTLWVDSVARRLVDIDYNYLGLDSRIMALHPGGRTSFRTMKNGFVMLDRWMIRLVGSLEPLPATSRAQSVERCPRGSVCMGAPRAAPKLQVHEIGGEIAYAAWPDGTEWSSPLGTLRARATRDGQPAPGVTVHLDNTDYAATTDATGAFEIDELLPGPYTVATEEERLARVGLFLPSGVSFTAMRDSTEILNVPVQSLEDYTWRACGNDEKRPRQGRVMRMLIVRAFEAGNQPVIGAKAVAQFLIGGSEVSKSEVETGSSGTFQICRFPESASDVAIFVDREGMPPFRHVERLSGVLTTTTLTLPTSRAPNDR